MQQKPTRIQGIIAKLREDKFMKRAIMLILFGYMFCAVNLTPWIHDYNIGIAAYTRKFRLSAALFVVFIICIFAMERRRKVFLSLAICVLLFILIATIVYSLQWCQFLCWAAPAITAAIDVVMNRLMFALYRDKA